MKAVQWWVAGCVAGMMMTVTAQAGIDGWVHQCRQDNAAAWCEQQGRKLAAASRGEAAAAFNINSAFSKLFASEFGTVTPGARQRPGAGTIRRSAVLDPADQERVRTPEGLRQYLFERTGTGFGVDTGKGGDKGKPKPVDKAAARAWFLYAGASKGAERVQWMQQAANAGDADAMYVLGYMHANGLDGLRRDDASAFQWFSKAAQAGNAAAMGVQARLLAARAGSEPVPADAAVLAGKACDKGAQSACLVLAELLLAGIDRAGNELVPEERAQIVARVLTLYSGVLLNESKGFTLEPERQAALYSMAKIYVDGRYLPPNKVEARDDLVRALNVDGAMLTDAWMTYADAVIAGPDGEYGFTQDTAKGLEILRRFADMGDVSATISLGRLLLGGHDGVAADPMSGRGLLKRAAAGGDTVAMTALALNYAAENNDTEAFKWVQQGVAAGDPYAMFLAAGHYQKGRGTDASEPSFRASLQKACELGYLRACVEIANRMLQGTDGFAGNPAGGMAMLEKARGDGSADASYALGTLKLRASSYYTADSDAELLEASKLLVEASLRGSSQADEFLAGVAKGDNAILKTAVARAKEELVPR